MNKRNKLSQIKDAFRQSTPDLSEAIDWNNVQNLGPTIDPIMMISTKPFLPTITYRRLAFLFSMVIVFIVGVIYIGSNILPSNTPNDTITEDQELAKDAVEPFSYAMISGTTLFHQLLFEPDMEQTGYVPNPANVWMIEQRMNRLHNYIPIVYQMLQSSTNEQVVHQNSDNISYQKQIIYSNQLINGEQVTYSIYYNIEYTPTKTISGMIVHSNDSTMFETTFIEHNQISYQFYHLGDDSSSISINQVIDEEGTTFYIRRQQDEVITSDAILHKNEDALTLKIINNDTVDATFDFVLNQTLQIDYKIGIQTQIVSEGSVFPNVSDYQFDQQQVYEVGSIVLTFGPDPTTENESYLYTITRPLYGTRTYIIES